jgi:hypothetical protein
VLCIAVVIKVGGGEEEEETSVLIGHDQNLFCNFMLASCALHIVFSPVTCA